jgi:hypothetical protein
MDLLPRLERERNSVQNHVLSYQVKSKGCFVWAAPVLQTGAIIKNRKQSFFDCSRDMWNSNPARVKAQEEVQRVFYIRNDVKLSVATVVSPELSECVDVSLISLSV